ncbi:MAG: Mini-ribonuclease 3 [Peptoniphilaceae bacterium]
MEKDLKFLNVSKEYNEKNIRELSPLSLAFLGDAVYELLVRTYLLNKNKNPKRLHIEAIDFVKAKAQAESMKRILGILTEEEISIYKRGRNAKSHTMPKNAEVSDYREATGFESLLGYLYLLKREDRIIEIFKRIEESKK